MNALLLKIIACATMLIDHIGYEMQSFGIGSADTAALFRIIGRVSFPIFAFMIAQGFKKTHNVLLYLIRILSVAVISELAYDLSFFKEENVLLSQNVLFTLATGLGALVFIDMCIHAKKKGSRIFAVLPLAAACFLAEKLGFDYGYAGILLICAFYFADSTSLKKRFAYLPIIALFSARGVIEDLICGRRVSGWSNITLYAIFSFVALFLYNGKAGPRPKSKAGRKLLQYFFYLFYPLHALAVYLVFSNYEMLKEFFMKIASFIGF